MQDQILGQSGSQIKASAKLVTTRFLKTTNFADNCNEAAKMHPFNGPFQFEQLKAPNFDGHQTDC